jgi:nucleoside-diphosphate-sugar epimerase
VKGEVHHHSISSSIKYFLSIFILTHTTKENMSSELIFLTGVTGFIGAATAQKALQAGYRLRLAVRKEAAIEKTKAIFSEYSDKIEFVVVPDITAENAFAKFLDGVDYILHLASPLANSTNAEEVFKPAVEGTLAILKDAAKVASVKKVVITSSIASLAPLSGVPEGGVIKGMFLQLTNAIEHC